MAAISAFVFLWIQSRVHYVRVDSCRGAGVYSLIVWSYLRFARWGALGQENIYGFLWCCVDSRFRSWVGVLNLGDSALQFVTLYRFLGWRIIWLPIDLHRTAGQPNYHLSLLLLDLLREFFPTTYTCFLLPRRIPSVILWSISVLIICCSGLRNTTGYCCSLVQTVSLLCWFVAAVGDLNIYTYTLFLAVSLCNFRELFAIYNSSTMKDRTNSRIN